MTNEIEIRQLRYFKAVADTLNFSKAAKTLHISQPPLSRQVRSLERSLGVTLLNRSSAGVSLTPAGKVFQAEVERIFLNIRHAAEVARRADRGELGMLRIGCSPFLELAIGKFLSAAEGPPLVTSRIDFETLPSVEQVLRLRQCSLDAGVVRLPLIEIDQLAIDVLGREPIVAVVASEHPLASRGHVSLRDLADTPLLIFGRKAVPARYDPIRRICCEAHLQAEVLEFRETVNDLLEPLRRGLKAGLMPGSIQYASLNGLTVLPLEDKHASIGVGLLHRREDRSPRLSRFLGSLRHMPSDFLYSDQIR